MWKQLKAIPCHTTSSFLHVSSEYVCTIVKKKKKKQRRNERHGQTNSRFHMYIVYCVNDIWMYVCTAFFFFFHFREQRSEREFDFVNRQFTFSFVFHYALLSSNIRLTIRMYGMATIITTTASVENGPFKSYCWRVNFDDCISKQ